jgi:ATP-dependent RNA helicase DDX20
MMKSPQEILLAPDAPSLKGVKQYYYLIPAEAMESSWKQWTAKVTKLLEIFSKISFHQCVVFTNDRSR